MKDSVQIGNVTGPLEYLTVKGLRQPRIKFVDPATLDDAFIDELYEMYHPYFNTGRAEFFDRMRHQINNLALFYSPCGDELVGFNGLRLGRFELQDGRSAMTVYLGLAIIIPEWRGRLLVQRMVIRMFLELRWLDPTDPIFVWCDALTVRPFLVASRYLSEYYPAPNVETPEHIQELRRRLGETYYSDTFDPERCVVKKASRKVKQHELSLQDRDDPLVQYYVECNPGYIDGDGLIIIQPATFENLWFFIKLMSGRTAKKMLTGLIA